MSGKGYRVYDILEGHNRPLDKALAQVDILFVKKDGILRISHKY